MLVLGMDGVDELVKVQMTRDEHAYRKKEEHVAELLRKDHERMVREAADRQRLMEHLDELQAEAERLRVLQMTQEAADAAQARADSVPPPPPVGKLGERIAPEAGAARDRGTQGTSKRELGMGMTPERRAMDATGRQQGWNMPDQPQPTAEELLLLTPTAKPKKKVLRQMSRESQHLQYDDNWNVVTPEPSAKKQLGLGFAAVDDEACAKAAVRMQAVTRGTLTRRAYEDERRREWIGYYLQPDVAQYEEALRLCVDEREQAMVQAAAAGVPMEASQAATAAGIGIGAEAEAAAAAGIGAEAMVTMTMPPAMGGWEEVHDPELGVYYFNEATGESQWEKPAAAAAAAALQEEQTLVRVQAVVRGNYTRRRQRVHLRSAVRAAQMVGFIALPDWQQSEAPRRLGRPEREALHEKSGEALDSDGSPIKAERTAENHFLREGRQRAHFSTKTIFGPPILAQTSSVEMRQAAAVSVQRIAKGKRARAAARQMRVAGKTVMTAVRLEQAVQFDVMAAPVMRDIVEERRSQLEESDLERNLKLAERERPRGEVVAPQTAEADMEAQQHVVVLPGGWEEVHDPELGVYYFNEATGESQWEKPAASLK